MASTAAFNTNTGLLLIVLVAVVGLVMLIAHCKLNAFLGLTVASLFVALCSGMKLSLIARAFQEGVGNTLGFIAVVVGLGTMLGKMLVESGGADSAASTFIRLLGRGRLQWAILLLAFVVGVPVFFGVGLVLLVPVLFTLIRQTGAPLLFLGIPMVAGLSVAHGLVPPHPGPMVAIEKLGADVGKTILYSVLIGFPTAVVAGPLFGKFIAARVPVPVDSGGLGARLSQQVTATCRPGFSLTLLTILLPVLLMLMATLAEVTLEPENSLRQWAVFIGSPLVALLLALLFSFFSFGRVSGFDREQISRFTEESVGPAANIILVVGAGGGFSKILEYSGAAAAIAELAKGLPLSTLVLGWVLAALIRVTVGSATVAITLASGIIAPIAATRSDLSPELLVIALGAGSLAFSHVNDGGFWFVKEYFNLTVPQMLKTWTVMETIIAVVALALVLLVNTFI